ncbi:MAG: AEC family transporter [Pseudomonadota bacterium]
MDAIVNVVLPVFGITFAGFLAGRLGLLGDQATEALNKFVFYFALPALLFPAMATIPLDDVFNWPFIAVYCGGMLATFGIGILIATFVFPNSSSGLTLHAYCAVFSNTGYMGIPLFIAAFGTEMTLPAIIATVINSSVVSGLAVMLIEADLAKGKGGLRVVGDALWSMLKSPLVFPTLAGIAMNFAGIPMPEAAKTFTSLLGDAAGPCALFALGLFLVGKPITAGLTEVSWVVLLKLIIHPAATYALIVWFIPLDPFWEMSAIVLAALPTGAIGFLLATRYGVYVQRSSAIILISTVISVATLSAIFVYYGIK